MKKALIVSIVAFVLLFTGCQNRVPTVTTGDDVPSLLPAQYNAQNKYLIADATNFQEADGFFFGTNLLGHYLQYYDKANGISGVLCADPACDHDSDECSAYIQKGSNLSYCDGNIYWVAEDADSSDKYLWKSDLSGKNRERIMQISFSDIIYPYQPQRYVVHQGNLYILGRASVVDGTQSGYRVSLLSKSLSGDEAFMTLYDETYTSGVRETYRFVGGNIYLSLVTFEDTVSSDLTITKFDIRNSTSEVIYQESGITESIGFVWVTEDDGIYFPTMTETDAYLWKLENNTRKEIASWTANKISMPVVMDGIAICQSHEENTRRIDIRNFSGETVYNGKLFPSEISVLENDPNTYNFAVVGGDTEKIIINLMEFADKTMVDYTILLDLKDNMKATILWSSRE